MKTVDDIPGPKPPPLLGWRGIALDFARDSVGYLHRLHDRYGKIARAGQGQMSVTFTFHPEYTRQILSNPNLFYSYSLDDIPFPFSDIEALRSMTTALSLLNGERHKQQRRLMAPAFHNNILPVYMREIIESVDNYFCKWRPGDVVDLYQEMDLFTIFMSMRIFVGMEPDEEGQRFADHFERVLRLLFSPSVFLLPVNFPGFPYRRLIVQGGALERELKDLIRRRRARGLDGIDTLSLFLQAHDEDGTKMTDNEIVGETVAVFRGGSKTSSGALTWIIFFLAQHPAIYADLRDELCGTLRGAAPTLEQLNRLPLLEGVVKEGLRLIPPVVWGVRYSIEDFDLGGYRFEKGDSVIYSSHVTHRMPEIYRKPLQFDPYRWETIKPSAYEYFPFNAGPRRCLGAEFAMLELKITLAILLQRFHFTLLPNQRIDRSGLTGSIPKNGIQFRLEKLGRPMSKVPVKGNVHNLVDLS